MWESICNIIQKVKTDIAPGGYKAKLTLADGSTTILDSALNGVLAKEGRTNVLNKAGEFIYDEVLYNTITTSKGEMYSTVLADGTKVWLNSQSPIRYPVMIKTTLLEGSIKLNVDAAVAWHNGYFQFNNADLIAVTRQPDRWYDVEVVYERTGSDTI